MIIGKTPRISEFLQEQPLTSRLELPSRVLDAFLSSHKHFFSYIQQWHSDIKYNQFSSCVSSKSETEIIFGIFHNAMFVSRAVLGKYAIISQSFR